ncbi:ribosomal protein S18-alanine N-acetyltransferase [Salidesulfovibrio brasiliensis]|uniref:ribosomal protein S18-alanine N-acetyltransferase n=1 Tax=Salidesulfovibrio brasiliensis TaxID=221711 RepID=UPI0006D06AFE|nr:ribosomal protein S18-alanine N-acetyltransferase [Salidesulfovibrio brasiliensis]
MRIRRAESRDIPEIVLLEKVCFKASWSKEQYLAGMDSGALRVMLAEDSSRICGYLAYTVIAGEMEILNVAVPPERRRAGIGKALLAAVLDEGTREDVMECFLDVRASNAPAIGLYGKFGFERIGRRKRYYPDNREDALLFRLNLDDTAADKQGVLI